MRSLTAKLFIIVSMFYLLFALLAIGGTAVVFSRINLTVKETYYNALVSEKKKSLEAYSEILEKTVSAWLIQAQDDGLSSEEKLSGARDLIRAASVGEKGYFFALDYDGIRLAYKPDPSQELVKNLYDAQDKVGNYLIRDMIEASQKGGDFSTYYWDNPVTEQVEPKVAYITPYNIDGYVFFVGIGEYLNDIDAATAAFSGDLQGDMFRFEILFVLGTIVVLITGLSILLFRLKTSIKPLKDIVLSFKDIASGDADLSVQLDVKSQDEIGDVALHFNEFISHLSTLVSETQGVVEETSEIKNSLTGVSATTGRAAGDINENIEELKSQTDRLNRNIEDAVGTIEQINSNTESFDLQIENQSSMVEESTAAINEMISSLNSVDAVTKNKQAAIDQLSAMMESGRDKLDDTTSGFEEVVGKVAAISEMADIIQAIASQTNLLSMNAAIEAAHAGEAGKGFAVVAEEIRKLADSSGRSSQSISAVVAEIATGISSTHDNVKAVDKAFEKISNEILSTSNAFNEIEQSVSELSIGGDQILKASNEINDATLVIRDGSSEIKNGVQFLLGSSGELRDISRQVSGGVVKISDESSQIDQSVKEIVTLNQNLNKVVNVLKSEFGKFKV